MADKVMSLKDVVKEIKDGNTIVFGGGGMQRKPMALTREIVHSDLKDLTLVVMLGGPEVDLLIGAGKVKKLIFGYVGFDSFGLAPNFRKARESGQIEVQEASEYMIIAALEASIKGLPFFPCRSGLGSNLIEAYSSAYQIFEAPFTGEKLVAVKAIEPDVALIHVNKADPSGYGQIVGDEFIDPICVRAAKKTFMSTEKIVSLKEIEKRNYDTKILKIWVDGVVEAPFGAHFTSCYPHYLFDFKHFTEYMDSTHNPEDFKAYLDRYAYEPKDHQDYLNRIKTLNEIKVEEI